MRKPYGGLVHADDLRRFVVLARAEHLTAAADELRIPQPSLSRSLRRVEDAFGARLFEREHRGLRLNPHGRVVLAAALQATTALDAAREQIAQLDDPDSGTVRLAFLHSVATTLVPRLLREYRAEAPAVRFALRQEASPTIEDDLASGEAELAITGPRPVDRALGWHTLERQRLCLVLPPAHRLARRGSVRLVEAAEEDFIVLRPGFGFRALTDRLCRAAGFVPRTAFESTDLATIEGLVGAGLGVAVLPAPGNTGRTVEGDAAFVPLRDAGARRDIGLVWRRTADLSPAAARFRDFVLAPEPRPA
jgi:LysR family transcriptional activator of glutamate synthase operon